MPDYAYDYGRLFIVQEPMQVYSILDNFRQKINLFGLCDPSHTRPFEMRPFLKLKYICYCFFCPVRMFLFCPVLGFCQRTLPFSFARRPKSWLFAFRGRDNSSFSDPDQCGSIPAAHVLFYRILLSNTLYRECVERKKTSRLTCVDWRSISDKQIAICEEKQKNYYYKSPCQRAFRYKVTPTATSNIYYICILSRILSINDFPFYFVIQRDSLLLITF